MSQYFIKTYHCCRNSVAFTYFAVGRIIFNHILLQVLRKASISAICIFVIECVAAQPYYFRHYQVEDGLSNNAVVCCLQDRKGFLWFGTKDGLNRFDGYTFKIFRNNPDDSTSIGNNFIHSLYADKNNILWAGTDKGARLPQE